MSHRVEWIKALNRQVLSSLAAKRQEVAARLEQAQRLVEECSVELANLDVQQEQVVAAEQVQIEHLLSAPSPRKAGPAQSDQEVAISAQAEDADKGRIKARIGPQRYLVLSTLRDVGPLSMEEVAEYTHLTPKRVKDALRADSQIGVVLESAAYFGARIVPTFALSQLGLDLLVRFESYKRQRGEQLPTLADARDEDADEAGSIESRQAPRSEAAPTFGLPQGREI